MIPNGQNLPEISSPNVLHEFLQASYCKFTLLPFPVIACTTFQNLSNRCSRNYDPSISRIFESSIWRVFDNWPNCVTQADVNALMHLKKKDNFSFLKHHARCYIICKLEREGTTLNKKTFANV